MNKDFVKSMARLHDMLGQDNRMMMNKSWGEMTWMECQQAIADNWLSLTEVSSQSGQDGSE